MPKPVEQPRKVAAVEQQPAQQRDETNASIQDNSTRLQPLPAATPGAAEPQAPTVVMPSSNAAYLSNPKPPYPAISRRFNEQGLVILRVLINTQGQAEQTELYQSSGHKRLDDSALKTVSTWRFVPGTTNGVPQAMWFNVPVNFVLE
jgi:protein TonB